jgi:hypothetical protein
VLRSGERIVANGAGYSPEEAIRVAVGFLPRSGADRS